MPTANIKRRETIERVYPSRRWWPNFARNVLLREPQFGHSDKPRQLLWPFDCDVLDRHLGANLEIMDALSFTPWRVTAEHRPLGNIELACVLQLRDERTYAAMQEALRTMGALRPENDGADRRQSLGHPAERLVSALLSHRAAASRARTNCPFGDLCRFVRSSAGES
jgi:hypothetical protein